MKIRIAFREEGSFWNAYMAHSDTMKDARLLGSILIGAARASDEVKNAFMTAMKLALAHAIEEVTGKAPEVWESQSAPEAERSGHS